MKSSLAGIFGIMWLLTIVAGVLGWSEITSNSLVAQPVTTGALTVFTLLTHYAVFQLGLGSFTSMALLSVDWRCSRRPSSYTLAIGALLLMPVCWSARDDIYSVARSFTWGAAILWCGQKIGQRKIATGGSRSRRESTGSLRPEANCGVGS